MSTGDLTAASGDSKAPPAGSDLPAVRTSVSGQFSVNDTNAYNMQSFLVSVPIMSSVYPELKELVKYDKHLKEAMRMLTKVARKRATGKEGALSEAELQLEMKYLKAYPDPFRAAYALRNTLMEFEERKKTDATLVELMNSVEVKLWDDEKPSGS